MQNCLFLSKKKLATQIKLTTFRHQKESFHLSDVLSIIQCQHWLLTQPQFRTGLSRSSSDQCRSRTQPQRLVEAFLTTETRNSIEGCELGEEQ